MAFKTYISLLLYFAGTLLVSAYNPDYYLEKNAIQWKSVKIFSAQDSIYQDIAYFNNCIFDSDGQTPLYSNKIPISGASNAPFTYKFSQLYFEPIPLSEMHLYPYINNKIKDSLEVKFKTGKEKKQDYLLFSFVPIRKNPVTGVIERVRYFVLEIAKPPAEKVSIRNLEQVSPSSSVLAVGDWFKFKVNKSGVYQILYSEIKNLGISNPENVRVYGNGGKMLPEVNAGNETTDLKEIPIQFSNGTDGIFNEGDYIVFYAQGPDSWQWNETQLAFEHQQNKFTDVISYFITASPGGKLISTIETPIGEPTAEVTSYDYLDYHEIDLYNLIRSGRDFYGEKFSTRIYYDFSFNVPNLLSTEKIKITSQVVARSKNNTSFQYLYNSQTIGNVSVPYVNVLSDLSNYANVSKLNSYFSALPGKIDIRVNFNKNNDESAEGWLDYIRISARQNLIYSNSQQEFRDIRSVGPGNIARFSVSANSNQLLIWNITDINNTQQVTTTFQNNTLSFKALADNLKTYIIFDPKSGLLRPQFIDENKGKINNQNLHTHNNIDFIIVTHPDFIAQANELAEIHRTNDNLTTAVVTTEEVYNEFSSGNPDLTAIRNYAKFLYDKANSADEAPKYLLLFGDGSYDRKSMGTSNTNFIITYQSANSLSPVSSYVSDDYFGLLDNDEQIESGSLDIGVGRFPVSSIEEAIIIIKKIRGYIDAKNFGSWRNQICFIGDDEDNNIHMQQADQLAGFVNQNYPDFNVNKIYLDAYPQISTSSGQRYPDANNAIYNQVNSGALIMNYTGHGNEKGLSHEQVIRQNEDINQWINKIHPLFVTATCEFSRFDDYSYQTAGEDVLLNPNGGGIALLTTTRLVYSGPNFILNQQFYNYAFTKDVQGEPLTLGEILLRTKNNSGSDINKLNFTLLGDPALKLAIPELSIITDSINKLAANHSDTLNAYQTVEIIGHIEKTPGTVFSDFNGTLSINIFDKSQKITSLGNDNLALFSFDVQNNSIFNGKATVKGGYFKVSFIIPRDIDYNYGFGKISYYATNNNIDASGNYSKLVIGGLSETTNIDNYGPVIKLFLNDTIFKNGGISNEFPTLFAKVSDDNGINPGGNGIGHDIIAYLDNDPSQRFILNSYFQSDLDNFKSGIVQYQLPQVTPGNHLLTFKVWDIFNNSSVSELNFVVLNSENLSISRAYNYPNPMFDNTNFFFEHNSQDENLDITIEIYNMSGKKIRNLYYTISPTGFTSGPMPWNGVDNSGKKISRGIYIYQIILRSNLGLVKSKSQKLVVIE